MSENTILAIEGLTKDYPGVRALDNVSLSFEKGEVHAIIGENGAGKSTLIKCLSGAVAPNGGSILIGGKRYNAMTPTLSKQNDIGVIYQEFNLVGSLSAAENVYLNEKIGSGVLVDHKLRESMAAEIFKQLNVELSPKMAVRELSPAGMQIVEIAKTVSKNVKILVMDEPTAPLTVGEVEVLFNVIRDLKAKGVTIIYISHRLEELFEIADRVSVLRDGCYVTTKDIADTNKGELISLMAGRELKESFPSRSAELGDEVLRVENLSGNGVAGFDFNLHKGEILGFAGLVGAGRTELMQVIFGAAPISGGSLFVKGKHITRWSPAEAISSGLGMVPEDRKRQGVFLTKSVSWNTTINAIKMISRHFIVDKKREAEIAESYQKRFDIKTPSLAQITANLSGGNQQKVAIAKTMAANADIIIFDEPTRGIDVGAKQEIYKLMNELVESGHAILMVSSEMPELIGMSDRIVVVSEGRQTGILSKEDFDQTRILEMASENTTIIA